MRSYTVKEFTEEIKSILTATYDTLISISGEISDISCSSAGHYYFRLKELGTVLNVAYFKNYSSVKNAFIPKHGDKVVVIGMVNLYEADGSYKFLARKIIFSSDGDLYKQFTDSKNRLELEGLFSDDRKKILPSNIGRIAVATSLQAAALKDFLSTIKRFNAKLEIDIFSIPVQGVQSVFEVIKVLDKIEQLSENYDILVITRGGGSLDDLSIFNDESLARKVSSMSVPVISAIGHERDYLILDFVADVRASTPTAAAEIVANIYVEMERKLLRLSSSLIDSFRDMIEEYSYNLDRYETALISNSPDHVLNGYRAKLSFLNVRIKDVIVNRSYRERSKLNYLHKELEKSHPLKVVANLKSESVYLSDSLMKNFKNIVANKKSSLSLTGDKLVKVFDNSIERKRSSLSLIDAKLKLLNPYNVLDRGYAIVSKDGGVFNSDTTVVDGDCLEIRLKDIKVMSKFITKENIKI